MKIGFGPKSQYKCVSLQYKPLLEFDTSRNATIVIDKDPALPWKRNRLPDDEPEDPNSKRPITPGPSSFCLQLTPCVCCRYKCAGGDCDSSEYQCGGGDGHRSDLLQVSRFKCLQDFSLITADLKRNTCL